MTLRSLDLCAAQLVLVLKVQACGYLSEKEEKSEELNKAGMLLLTVLIPQRLKMPTVPWTTTIATTAVRPATASRLLTARLPSPTLLCTSFLCLCHRHSSCYFRAVPGTLAMTLCKVMTLNTQSGGLLGGYWEQSTFFSRHAGPKMQPTSRIWVL